MTNELDTVEQELLGCMINVTGDSYAHRILDYGVKREWFVNHTNRKIFDAIEELSLSGDVTRAELTDKLDQMFDDGMLVVMDLFEQVTIPARWTVPAEVLQKRYHANIVKREANRARRASDESPEEAISDFIEATSDLDKKEEPQNNEDIIAEHEAARNGNPNSIPAISKYLTKRTGGLKKGMVTVLTGRTASGKSMLKTFWMKKLAEKGFRGVDYCFEDHWKISKKRMASIGKYEVSQLDAGGRFVKVKDHLEWWPTLQEKIDKERLALEEIDELPVWWIDRKMNMTQLRASISKMHRMHDIDYVFVDGAKDMKRPSGTHNKAGFEEEVSQKMTQIAQEFNIAIIAIHHLTKLGDDDLITMGHIRGSGNIASDARMVWALQGDKNGAGLENYEASELVNTDDDGYVTSRVLSCVKNNHGRCARVWLETDLGKCLFKEI